MSLSIIQEAPPLKAYETCLTANRNLLTRVKTFGLNDERDLGWDFHATP